MRLVSKARIERDRRQRRIDDTGLTKSSGTGGRRMFS